MIDTSGGLPNPVTTGQEGAVQADLIAERRAYKREWARKNRARLAEYKRDWYVRSRDHVLKRVSLYQKAHPLQAQAWKQASKKMAPGTRRALKRIPESERRRPMSPAGGRPRRDLSSVRGHTGESPLRKWSVLTLLVQGKSYDSVGRELHRDLTTIASAAQQMGFSGRGSLYDFGEPVTGALVAAQIKATGLSVKEAARSIHIPEWQVADVTRARRAASHVQSRHTQTFVAWRDETVRRLLADVGKPHRGADRRSTSDVLKTFFPNLRNRCRLFLAVLKRVRAYLRVHPDTSLENLQDWLCEEAMFEIASQHQKKLFGSFLPWAPSLWPAVEKDLNLIRGPGNLWPLVLQVVASRFSTTRHVVQGSWKARARRIPPHEMRSLIQLSQLPVLSIEVRDIGSKGISPKKRGRPQGITTETRNRIKLIAAFTVCGFSLRRMAPRVFPAQLLSAKSNIYRFSHEHRTQIAAAKANLTSESAQKIIDAAST